MVALNIVGKIGRLFSTVVTTIFIAMLFVVSYVQRGFSGVGKLLGIVLLALILPIIFRYRKNMITRFRAMFNKRRCTSVPILFLSLILFPSISFATTYEIYTYGNGEFLGRIFNGLAMLMASNGIIYGLIKPAAIILFLVAVTTPIAMAAAGKGQLTFDHGFMPIVRIPLIIGIVVYGMMIPKADVMIVDRQDPSQINLVANVPMIHAVISSTISLVGDKIGEEFDTVFFGTLDGLKFRNGGVAMGVKYTGTLMSIHPPSNSPRQPAMEGGRISTVLQEYFIECAFPNFAALDGPSEAKSGALTALFASTDLPLDLYTDTSLTGRVFNVSHIEITGMVAATSTCRDAIHDVYAKWTENTVYDPWLEEIEKTVAGDVGATGLAQNASINLGSGSYTEMIKNRYFPNSNLTTKDFLIHIATLNMLRDAASAYAMTMGSPADNANSLAARQAGGAGFTAATMLNKMVGSMRNIIEGLAYGLSALLPILLFTGSFSPLFTFAKILIWLQLWVPFYVILNLFADLEYARALVNLGNATGTSGPAYAMLIKIAEQSDLSMAYVGSLSWTVPTLAWGLVSGVAAGVSSLASSAGTGGGAQSTASSTGGEVVGKGNITAGVKSFASSQYGQSNLQTSGHRGDKEMQTYLGTKDSKIGMDGMRDTAMVQASEGAGKASGMGTSGRAFDAGEKDAESKIGTQSGEMNVAKALGMSSMEDYKKWGAEGKNIDQPMADRLQGKGFAGVEKGMQMDSLSVGADGKINSLTASKNDGSSSVAFKDGSVIKKMTNSDGTIISSTTNANGEGIKTKEEKDPVTGGYKMSVMDAKTNQQLKANTEAGEKQSYQMNKEQATAFADYQDALGHHGIAKQTRDIANKLGPGEAAQINTQLDNSGNSVGAKVGHDYEASHKDTGTNIVGNTSSIGNEHTNKEYNKIHEGADGHSYRMTGVATTYGEGKDAITKMDLRSAMMQEVDGKGNAIGEKYSAGAAIQGGKIVNLEAEKGTDINTADKKTTELARGTNVSGDTMWAAAISGDTTPAQRIADAGTVPGREREETAQAQALSKTLNEKASWKGDIATMSSVKGSGNVKVGTPMEGVIGTSASVGAEVSVSRQNRETKSQDMFYGAIRNMQKNAREESTVDGKLDEKKYTQAITKGYQDMAQGVDDFSKGKDSSQYGAFGIVGEPIAAAQAMYNKYAK